MRGIPRLGMSLQSARARHATPSNPTRTPPRMFDIGPDFETVANTPGMTATALNAFLLTSHPKMPNLILSPEQSADVIAYILTLRGRPDSEKPK